MFRFLFVAFGLLPLLAKASAADPVATVPEVDLARYLGRWYEIASYPMYFQRRCIGDVTADYTQLAPGRIGVLNRCRTEDGFIEANGKARIVDNSGNARLQVSFFWPFSAPYWIIGLDSDYRWVVVGHPERKTLWILARQPALTEPDWLAARRAAEAQGYDLAKLKPTRHTPQQEGTADASR